MTCLLLLNSWANHNKKTPQKLKLLGCNWLAMIGIFVCGYKNASQNVVDLLQLHFKNIGLADEFVGKSTGFAKILGCVSVGKSFVNVLSPRTVQYVGYTFF